MKKSLWNKNGDVVGDFLSFREDDVAYVESSGLDSWFKRPR